jgi:hypothetical protein
MSLSRLSKAQSHTSLRLKAIDDQRVIAFNSDLALKLSYSWKNIYRALLQADLLKSKFVTTNKLNEILLDNNVILTKEEIRRLVKLSKNDQEKQARQNSGEFKINDSPSTQLNYI